MTLFHFCLPALLLLPSAFCLSTIDYKTIDYITID